MSDEVDFDVIVVGAGPAGSVAAHLLAEAGHSVLLVERGETPGSKNLSGGVLYGQVLQQVFPDYHQHAPVERRITRNVVKFVNSDSSVGLDYSSARLADPVNAVTVLRARFDPWLAERAEESGAMLMSSVKVDELLTEPTASGSRVIGIRAGEDELRSHVVIAADGVNSFLSQGIGLRHKPPLNHLAVGVKSTIALDEETINDRFGVASGEGAAHALVGDCTRGVGGGAFMYTNRESISLGVVLRLDDLKARGQNSAEVHDHLLSHPVLAPFLRGGEIIEYGSHLVAEGGRQMIGDIHTDGLVVVGDAAGLTINSGLTVRGMDLAIGSAIAAAEAIHSALDAGDTSAVGLARYRELLFESFVGKDMELYRHAPDFLERPRVYNEYGPLLETIMYGIFNLDTTPRKPLRRVALDSLRQSPTRLRDLMSDVWAGMRSL